MGSTFFFRDAPLIDLIADRIVPLFKDQKTIDIWTPGSCSGQEAYTIAAIFRNKLSSNLFNKIRIYASDIRSGMDEIIEDGIYNYTKERQEVIDWIETVNSMDRIKSKSEISDWFLRDYDTRLQECIDKGYFVGDKSGITFQISDELKRIVTYTYHDINTLNPLRIDNSIIVCKHCLCHFKSELMNGFVKMFHDGLIKNGIFIVDPAGGNERLRISFIGYFTSIKMDNLPGNLYSDIFPTINDSSIWRRS